MTNPNTGIYCIQFTPSVDVSTAVLIATPDYEHSTTFSGALAAYVYPDGSIIGCAAPNSMAVVTGFYGISAGPPPTPNFTPTNESFTFAVP